VQLIYAVLKSLNNLLTFLPLPLNHIGDCRLAVQDPLRILRSSQLAKLKSAQVKVGGLRIVLEQQVFVLFSHSLKPVLQKVYELLLIVVLCVSPIDIR
jgi:hypothetical protein